MSPLYDLAPRDILSKQFEIIVTLDGTTQETGNQIQVRSSYLPNEILWGYRFEHTCVAYDKEETKYSVSYTMLNKFVADRTPRFSAKEIDLRRQKRSCFSNYSSISEDIH
ncbi:ATP-sensitive inward rectifier potassium channel 8 [Eurytemora carolleeae]|uniref:ATP-sensitive inward rectifier potassium channel 8 n=1 Tax=Eurytemora carolleeae TaxID=1294199 RepID=UPI000C75ADBE|nr:ATP-sensitive inward rectifier potassium channel 8 [Eurytemora carolleeae]|eukprot:XP_023321179.1 ATP-sensitive inward rectifier potassium channel 8-like [Eurytemora affinis]